MRTRGGFALFGRMLILMTGVFPGSSESLSGEVQRTGVSALLVFGDWMVMFLVEELLAGMVGVGIRNWLFGCGGADCDFFGGCESVGGGEDGLVEHCS